MSGALSENSRVATRWSQPNNTSLCNQGLTMYAQRRICTEILGQSFTCLEAATGKALLMQDIDHLGEVCMIHQQAVDVVKCQTVQYFVALCRNIISRSCVLTWTQRMTLMTPTVRYPMRKVWSCFVFVRNTDLCLPNGWSEGSDGSWFILGYCFVSYLRSLVGSDEDFDAFLKGYVQKYAYKVRNLCLLL